MGWFEKLRDLKANSDMSMREISIKSGMPEPTIEKIFSGATKSPGINTIQSLVHALGYSLDDIDSDSNKESPSANNDDESEKFQRETDISDNKKAPSPDRGGEAINPPLYELLTPENRAKADSYLAFLLAEQQNNQT